MSDRRQIADELWEAFKHWEGERKFALRQVVKMIRGEGNVDTDDGLSGAGGADVPPPASFRDRA